MVADLAISLLAVALGSLGMLLLLLMGFGGGTSAIEPESFVDPVPLPDDREPGEDRDGPFIPMPAHLTTADDMIAWMTRDLPRLTAEAQRSRP